MRKVGKIFAIAGMTLAVLLALFNGAPRDFWVDDTQYAGIIAQAARRNGVPPALVRAVIFQESRFDPFVRGRHGEIGLMQVLPQGAVADWARLHRTSEPDPDELFDPRLNIEIGSWYLGRALRRWQGYRSQTELALCHYNAGESRANRWKPTDKRGAMRHRITIPGTRDYVNRIMKRYHGYLRKKTL